MDIKMVLRKFMKVIQFIVYISPHRHC